MKCVSNSINKHDRIGDGFHFFSICDHFFLFLSKNTNRGRKIKI